MPSFLLLPLQVALTALDFAIFLVTFGWLKLIPRLFASTPLRSVPVNGDEAHRIRAGYTPDTLVTSPDPDCVTMHDLMEKSFDKYSDRKTLGSRTFLGYHKGNQKVKAFGETKWMTYSEVRDVTSKFGASLRAAGLTSAPPKATLDAKTTSCTLAIFENTCPQWFMAAVGAFSQGISVTTLYATLGMDAVVDAVQEGQIAALLCNKKSLGGIAAKIGEMKSLKTVIYTNDIVAPGDTSPVPSVKGVTFISFDDFVAKGDTKKFPKSPPKAESEAVVMYTSGSTGKPKGVIITHKNALAVCGALGSDIPLNDEDTHLGYLPLAHIMEFSAEFVCFYIGTSITYADPKSLTATGAFPHGALEEFKPTVMVGVPKIWDVIKKGIEAKISKASPVVKFLYKTAFTARTFAQKRGYDTPLFKKLVFKKISAATGGRLRLGLAGGGPLSEEIQIAIRANLGIPFGQGYGLTETCAGLSVQDILCDTRSGVAGVPLTCLEVKIESCPEVNDKAGLPYLAADRKDADGNNVLGRGEILVRGHNVSLGYYKMKDKTDEVFDKDGWFHTGDIGQWLEDGSLRIVDRRKNLVKLKGGEYIAVEQMELVYGNSVFVDAINGGICCYGDGDMDRPVALVQLSMPAAMSWAKENGIAGDYETIAASPELNAAVHKALLVEHKKGGLTNLEKLIAVSILTKPWTPENGCLTPTNKLQRKVVTQVFKKEFDAVKDKGIFK